MARPVGSQCTVVLGRKHSSFLKTRGSPKKRNTLRSARPVSFRICVSSFDCAKAVEVQQRHNSGGINERKLSVVNRPVVHHRHRRVVAQVHLHHADRRGHCHHRWCRHGRRHLHIRSRGRNHRCRHRCIRCWAHTWHSSHTSTGHRWICLRTRVCRAHRHGVRILLLLLLL